ncbi:MAG: RDD family protein [Thermoleophilaceae bacterium]|nr:RDD family protein [Thermoleophilaceae bacterium]
MESGSPPPEQPERVPGQGPQAPPPGPQTPPPGPQAPTTGYTAIPGGPETPPSGWEQPIATSGGWQGQPLASWGSRVGATLLDWLILLVPALILFFVVVAGAVGISGDDDTSTGAAVAAVILYVVLILAVMLLYAPLLMMREGAHNGQTLGKQVVGIRVVRNNGERMGFLWAALREVVIKGLAVGIASSIIPFLPWLLDSCWPLWDDQNRALHDMAAQTHVVTA